MWTERKYQVAVWLANWHTANLNYRARPTWFNVAWVIQLVVVGLRMSLPTEPPQ